jgi:Trk-type K+ transport system membrane component
MTIFREAAQGLRGDAALTVCFDRLCGAFRPLSKVVIILVMIRGRHRGLPVAVSETNDRASSVLTTYRHRSTEP